MKNYLGNSKLLLPVLIVSLFFSTAALGQKTWTRAAGNDNWSSPNNWNPVGVPTAGDAVIIPDNALFTFVNVDINASCASLTISGGVHPLTFTVKTFVTFNVTNTSGGTGLINIGAPADGSSDKIIIIGEILGLHTSPVLNCVALTMANVTVPFSDDIILNIRSGVIAISRNLTLNGSSDENEVSFLEGKLVIGGTFNNGGNFLTGVGTVEYNGANQIMRSATYNNLTVSGSGAKSTAVTVKAKLSIQGTATVTNTITYYDHYSLLEYKGSIAQITSNIEFPANMPARVIIDNPAGVGLNSNKTIAEELTLVSGNLIAGNKLSMGAAGTPTITRSGGTMTGTLQSPANDYDVNYTGNSKTTGAELSGGSLKNIYVLLYNPSSMETLTLDQNRVPDGDLYISYGTFNLSTFTINRSTAGGVLTVAEAAILKTGGMNSLPLNYTYDLKPSSVVEYTGTNQLVKAATYGNLIVSGSGTKTVSTAAATNITDTLIIQGGVAFTVAAANFTVQSKTTINGTLNSTSTIGNKIFANMYIKSGGLFNSSVSEDYTIQGVLKVNGTGSINSGLGLWTLSPFADDFEIGGTGAASITNVYIPLGHCYNTGNFTFATLRLGSNIGLLHNKGIISITDRIDGGGLFYQKANSTLNCSGDSSSIFLPAGNFQASATGNTVNFNGAGYQEIRPTNYYNLTFSVRGEKRFSWNQLGRVNGTLSIQGTTFVSLAPGALSPIFGPEATLEYAGSAAQTSTNIEFKSTGGPKNLIINNPLGVTLHASRTVDGTVTISNGILNIPASTILTIANGNAIIGTGFGAAKHINTKVSGANQGVLRVDKIAAGSPYFFPMGNGTYYLPATLTTSDANISNNTFSVSVFQGITTNGLPNGTAIADKSNLVDAVWTINNNIGITTLPVDMVLGWSGLEGVNFSALADNLIGIAHYDNPAWGDFTGNGNQLNNTATRSGITSFSPFAVGQSGVFNSSLMASPYSTAKDILTPGEMSKGLTYSDKRIKTEKGIPLMRIFPNPVSNKLQLHFAVNKTEKIELKIIAADGKTVYDKAFNLQPGKNITAIDVTGFLKGTYYATALFENKHTATIQFIK